MDAKACTGNCAVHHDQCMHVATHIYRHRSIVLHNIIIIVIENSLMILLCMHVHTAFLHR